MAQRRIHLVRHGEVDNPDGVLYGRLPGFALTERGRRSAQAAATALLDMGRPIAAVWTSPLERARESADPVARAFGLEVRAESGLIEASSKLEGGRFRMDATIFTKPAAWRYLVNPFRPSWGEPFVDVADRVEEVIRRAAAVEEPGDVVLVSHQLPIWMAHRRAVGKPLFHNPGARRCALSSVTSFVLDAEELREVGYIAPVTDALDVGAV